MVTIPMIMLIMFIMLIVVIKIFAIKMIIFVLRLGCDTFPPPVIESSQLCAHNPLGRSQSLSSLGRSLLSSHNCGQTNPNKGKW